MNRRLLAVSLALWLAWPQRGAWAQEEVPPPPPAPMELPAEESRTGEAPESSAAPASEAEPDRARPDAVDPPAVAPPRLIYVPYDKLPASWRDPAAQVLIPYAEHQLLLEARRAAEQARPSPAPVVQQADYQARIDGDFVRIDARLEIVATAREWSRVRLNFGDAAIGAVEFDERLLLEAAPEGGVLLHIPEPGTFLVTLQLAVERQESGVEESFSLVCPSVPRSTFDLSASGAAEGLRIEPSGLREPVEKENGVTRVKVQLPPTEKIAVRWTSQPTERPELSPLLAVVNHCRLTLEPGLLQRRTWLTYDLLRGSVKQLQIAIPGGERVLDLTSNIPIRSWKLEARDGGQIAVVDLAGIPPRSFVLDIRTERPLAPDETDLPVLGSHSRAGATRSVHAVDVARESGLLAVHFGRELSVRTLDDSGTSRVDTAELPEGLKGPEPLAIRYAGADAKLTLQVTPQTPRLSVQRSEKYTFIDSELHIVSELKYRIERVGVFELEVDVPKGLQIESVAATQLQEHQHDADTGLLRLIFSARQTGDVSVKIASRRSWPPDASAALPWLSPRRVTRDLGEVAIWAGGGWDVFIDAQSVAGAEAASSQSAPGLGGGLRPVSFWKVHTSPPVLPARVVRKPARLSAEIGTTIEIQPSLTRVATQLDYHTEHAPLNRFRFAVPEGLNSRLQIEAFNESGAATPLLDQSSAPPENGRVLWTVRTQQPVLGRLRLRLTWDGLGAGEQAEERTFSLVRPLGLEDGGDGAGVPLTRVQGEVTIRGHRDLSLAVTQADEPLEAIDPRELKLISPGALAYRYARDDGEAGPQLRVSATTYEIEGVVSTIVSRGLIEIVTGQAADATYRARFRLLTSERQRLLLQLPVQLTLLGAFINDREVKLERANVESPGELWTPYWVNVARPESSETELLLTLQFLWKVNPALGESDFGRGDLELPLPLIGDRRNVATQQLKVVIWTPEEFVLVGDPERFELQTRRRWKGISWWARVDHDVSGLEQWISPERAVSVGALPTDGRVPFVYNSLGGAELLRVRWWNRLGMTLLLSGALALIGWILAGTSWANKLSILFLGGFAAALVGVQDAHLLDEGLYAARFGLVVVLALWIVGGVWRCLRSRREPPPAKAPSAPATSSPAAASAADSTTPRSSTGEAP